MSSSIAWLLRRHILVTFIPGLQDMVAHFAGQEVSLAVLEVTRASRKVVCSVVKAKENNDLRHLEVGSVGSLRCSTSCHCSWLTKVPLLLIHKQVGSLITGTVRRIEPFGVFVGINNTRISGLLHISNVSRQHIDTVQASHTSVHSTCRASLVFGTARLPAPHLKPTYYFS